MSLNQKCNNCKYEHLNKFYNETLCLKEDLIGVKEMGFEPEYEDDIFVPYCNEMNDSDRCLYYDRKKWKFWVKAPKGELA